MNTLGENISADVAWLTLWTFGSTVVGILGYLALMDSINNIQTLGQDPGILSVLNLLLWIVVGACGGIVGLGCLVLDILCLVMSVLLVVAWRRDRNTKMVREVMES